MTMSECKSNDSCKSTLNICKMDECNFDWLGIMLWAKCDGFLEDTNLCAAGEELVQIQCL